MTDGKKRTLVRKRTGLSIGDVSILPLQIFQKMKSQLKRTNSKFFQPRGIYLIKSGLIAISILAFVAACTKSKSTVSGPGGGTVDCSGAPKKFSTDVNPIIASSCATNSGCHGTGSINGPGELTSYSKIFNARTDMRSAILSGIMPLNGSLTSAQINSIVCWIDNGAPNN